MKGLRKTFLFNGILCVKGIGNIRRTLKNVIESWVMEFEICQEGIHREDAKEPWGSTS
jgi:hypothetical protein